MCAEPGSRDRSGTVLQCRQQLGALGQPDLLQSVAARHARMSRAPSRLMERYEKLSKIGEGSYGVVYKVRCNAVLAVAGLWYTVPGPGHWPPGGHQEVCRERGRSSDQEDRIA